MKKIIIVDDSVPFRAALRETLNEITNVEIIGEAENGAELLRILRHNKPDIIFMDIEMPFINGFEATESVLAVFPDIKVIGMSSYEKEKFIHKLIDVGAVGYMLKTSDNFEVIKNLVSDNYTAPFTYSPEINNNVPLLMRGLNALVIDYPNDTNLNFRHTIRKAGYTVLKVSNMTEATYFFGKYDIHTVIIESEVLKRNDKLIERLAEFQEKHRFNIYILSKDLQKPHTSAISGTNIVTADADEIISELLNNTSLDFRR